jgi:phospholipid/cholesterol/gamma-HCH transport system permease protein
MPFESRTKLLLKETGNIAEFAGHFVIVGSKPRYEIKEFIKQCFVIGYRSLGLVALTGFIMGLVLTMQLQPFLISYGVDSQLPAMVGIAIIREVGPVVTALIYAGKIGSSIGAELGSMKVTEQIDAMEVSGTNPFRYLVATRIVAATLMLPVLTLLGNAISLFGAYIGVNLKTTTGFHLFFTEAFQQMGYIDIIPSVIKTFFFGFAVGLIGCYKGYNSGIGTQGVGKAANTAVVLSSVLIFIIDLLAVQITNLFNVS